MANITPEPDDILGTRPAGEGRAGAAKLLLAGLGLLRHRALRAWLLAVLTLAILYVTMHVAHSPLMIGVSITEGLGFVWYWPLAILGAVANIAAGAPFLAAYVYALLLLLQGRRASPRTLFVPFRRGALLANTAIAGSAAPLVEWLLPWLWRLVPWSEIQPNLVEENSLLAKAFRLIPVPEWLIHWLPHWIGVLLAVPLAWSALNVLVLGSPGLRAIAQSVRLTRRHWRLAALYLAAAVLLPLTLWVLAPLWDFTVLNKGIARELLSGLATLCSLLLSSVILLLESLVLVLVYREMVWREREAEGRARLDSPARVP
jgi:hypothetical protein